MPVVMHFEPISMDAISMRLRGGCSTVVPMPADVLSSCIVMLPWVRLEARPFHIPPCIALLGWLDCFGFGYVDELRIGADRRVRPRVTISFVTMRLRRGCSTVVPMPADVLSSCIVMLPWVRLEARPFHIPPRIALLGCLDCFGFGYVDELRIGADRRVRLW